MRAIRITQANWLNDQVGGDRNDIKLVQDEMAYGAVEVHQIAVYAPEYDPVPFPVMPAETAVELQDTPLTVAESAGQAERDAADELVKMSEELGLYDDPPHQPWEDAAGPSDVEPPKMPWITHSKAKWVEWAIHQGANSGLAAAMTKNELMSRYGERL
ncbi:MAG TPA: hypothetical protein VGG75_14340 [Trebonia sp.]|jgi:hypothetical protein